MASRTWSERNAWRDTHDAVLIPRRDDEDDLNFACSYVIGECVYGAYGMSDRQAIDNAMRDCEEYERVESERAKEQECPYCEGTGRFGGEKGVAPSPGRPVQHKASGVSAGGAGARSQDAGNDAPPTDGFAAWAKEHRGRPAIRSPVAAMLKREADCCSVRDCKSPRCEARKAAAASFATAIAAQLTWFRNKAKALDENACYQAANYVRECADELEGVAT